MAHYPKQAKLTRNMRHPLVGATLAISKIQAAKASGAIGVILVWQHISTGLAKNEILPFTNAYLDIPAIWVHEQQLDKLQTISAQATTVGLTITGSYQRDVPTESFVVVVEGQQPEQQIFINSHTDGPNDLEENGAIALLTLLQAIKNHDLKFKQTLVFGFVSGHFQIPQSGLANRQATSRLLRDFEAYETKHNIAIQKVLGLTIEHLGGAEYEDDLKQNALKLKSPDDPMFIYISNAKNKTLVEQCLTEINPVGQYFLLKARKTAYFGEGQPLFQAGWPTISFIAMPLALCQLGAAETEPDINTMYDQINLILAILIASTQQLDV
ncbi:hypothetical protein JCM14202_3116 [Agrilactobacillus composti DSM 18527 = JCM 14202]|nr:hypothetical protein [Agrilactobacillus composti]GAF41188.1 hypothetical protein JCM14202_3116 [Agrilactobacillus composti DSM 18527 = JCM 14202]